MDHLPILAVVALSFTLVSGSPIVVNTNVGHISGQTNHLLVDGKFSTISKFSSIPFAETTAGENRFKKPIPKAPFTSTFDATKFPLGCIQSSNSSTQTYGKYVNFTEDCLTLNIYVPHDFKQQNVSLPVMIWIYGGGFTAGATGIYDADGISAFGNVVVVTVNYRLGMFGFLRSSDGQLVGNQGLWDQHLGIKWVHDNIAAFTGNPNAVTIFGESAGSASVIYQALYAGNKGYFHRVVAESGSPLSEWANLKAPNAEEFITYKGCDKGPISPIACLRSKTPEALQYNLYGKDDKIFFRPIYDNDFLVAQPKDILFGNDPKTAAARSFFSSLDIVMGVNNFEGGLYIAGVWPFILGYTDINTFTLTRDQWTGIVLPTVVQALKPKNNATANLLIKFLDFAYTDWTKPNNSDSLRFSLTNISSDVPFFYPVISTTQAHAGLGIGSTYFYEFSVIPTKHTLLTPSWIHGSNHADEIQYVFGYPLFNAPQGGHYTSDEIQLARTMVTMWTNFAKTGNPNFPNTAPRSTTRSTIWPQYDLNSQSFLHVFNKMLTIGQRFQARRMELWADLIPHIQTNIHSYPSHIEVVVSSSDSVHVSVLPYIVLFISTCLHL